MKNWKILPYGLYSVRFVDELDFRRMQRNRLLKVVRKLASYAKEAQNNLDSDILNYISARA